MKNITLGDRGAETAWRVTPLPAGCRVQGGTVGFDISSARGGLLRALHWGIPLMPPLEQLHCLVGIGRFYDPRALNRLADSLQGGRPMPVRWKSDKKGIRVVAGMRTHDLDVTTEYRAAPGLPSIDITVRVVKRGPGGMQVQCVPEMLFASSGDGERPQCAISFESAGEQKTCTEVEDDGVILDQDTHVSERAWLLSARPVRFAPAGSAGHALRAEILGDAPCCLSVRYSGMSRTCLAGLYGPNRTLCQGDRLQTTLRLAPVPVTPPCTAMVRRPLGSSFERALEKEGASLPRGRGSRAVAAYRRRLHAWKCNEARMYRAGGNVREARALLADAARIRELVERAVPADLPETGELLYENSFRRLPDDWMVFGFGDYRSDPAEGLFVGPEVTMNLWSRKQFAGDIRVDLDYRPEPGARAGSGTFLQLCGRPVQSRAPVDFMASATGRMADYNFGIRCYHISFNRRSARRDRTNFRKTGDAFRLLALTETLCADTPRWHRLSAVKRGRQFLFFVNGTFVLEYYDEGRQGPFLDGGHLGLRNWGGMRAWFRDLRVYRLAPGRASNT